MNFISCPFPRKDKNNNKTTTPTHMFVLTNPAKPTCLDLNNFAFWTEKIHLPPLVRNFNSNPQTPKISLLNHFTVGL